MTEKTTSNTNNFINLLYTRRAETETASLLYLPQPDLLRFRQPVLAMMLQLQLDSNEHTVDTAQDVWRPFCRHRVAHRTVHIEPVVLKMLDNSVLKLLLCFEHG